MPRQLKNNDSTPLSLLFKPFTPEEERTLDNFANMPNRLLSLVSDLREELRQAAARMDAQQLAADTEPNSETELGSDSMSTETAEAETRNMIHP